MKMKSKLFKIFKSPKVTALFKMLLLTAYCTLICAAILFSFKSVFNAITGTESDISDNFISELIDNFNKSSDYLDVLSKVGSRGDEIMQVQTVLKNMGYYSDGVDGIFGIKTQDAIMRFQKARGLTADGIAGPQTLKALGLQVDAISANNDNDINLLARFISAEAGGEPYAGQVAVGAVVLNRVKHSSFPNSISAVIYQPDAFSCIKNGQFDQPVTESAYRAARDALNNADPVGGAIYYYNPKTSTNERLRAKTIISKIGSNVFCS